MAPPPGTNLGLIIMFLETARASWRFLSSSFKTSLDAPLRRIVQALGFLHSRKKVKNSSPILLISNRPHWVPMSDSWISSGLLTILAPETLATLLLSVFLILDHRDVLLHQEVLSEVGDTFFCDENIRLVLHNLVTDTSNLVHLLLKSISHISILGHF